MTQGVLAAQGFDMRVIQTDLEGVLILEPVVHRDDRGFFLEVYHREKYAAAGLPIRFDQENHSRSVRHSLRGLHWQWRRPQAKLVRVIVGEVFDVAVDIRRGSPDLGRWTGTLLSADNFRQLFIPEGFAHGFFVTSDVAEVEYKCTDVYDPGGEGGLRWDDPALGIQWPAGAPILSAKDRAHPRFSPDRHDLPEITPDGLRWIGAQPPVL